jgi:hypothetical protein
VKSPGKKDAIETVLALAIGRFDLTAWRDPDRESRHDPVRAPRREPDIHAAIRCRRAALSGNSGDPSPARPGSGSGRYAGRFGCGRGYERDRIAVESARLALPAMRRRRSPVRSSTWGRRRPASATRPALPTRTPSAFCGLACSISGTVELIGQGSWSDAAGLRSEADLKATAWSIAIPRCAAQHRSGGHAACQRRAGGVERAAPVGRPGDAVRHRAAPPPRLARQPCGAATWRWAGSISRSRVGSFRATPVCAPSTGSRFPERWPGSAPAAPWLSTARRRFPGTAWCRASWKARARCGAKRGTARLRPTRHRPRGGERSGSRHDCRALRRSWRGSRPGPFADRAAGFARRIFRRPGRELRVHAETRDLADILPALGESPADFPVKLTGGAARFDGVVRGKLSSPQFSGHATAGGFSWSGRDRSIR